MGGSIRGSASCGFWNFVVDAVVKRAAPPESHCSVLLVSFEVQSMLEMDSLQSLLQNDG